MSQTGERELEGKVAVITGAASGMGRATAIELGAAGASIVAADVNGDGLESLREELTDAGTRCETVAGDVSEVEVVERYVAKALDDLGGLDCFYNNAGIAGALIPLAEYPIDEFDRVMRINLRSVFLGLRLVLPEMAARGGGAIVNTSSVAGLTGTPNQPGYTAAKHAVIGLTHCAALENGPAKIRVNAICPGPIATPLMDDFAKVMAPDDPDALTAGFAERIPLKRFANPAEVARLVRFLVSDRASFVTGAVIRVDGGMLSMI